MNHIGERIREFRKAAGISQEKLAEQLGVSSQAVSKWETCAAMPDLTMLVPLSNLLGVTTDRLLGTDEIRQRELNDQWGQIMRKYGEGSEECIEHDRRALLEFPDDFTWNYRLAMDLVMSAEYCDEPDQRVRRLETSLNSLRKLQRLVAEGKASDSTGTVDSSLVEVLSKLNRRDEARRIAEASSHRDTLLKICLTGEEREIHVRTLILSKLFSLFWELRFSKDPETLETGYHLAEFIFPDSAPSWILRYLYENAFTIARARIESGQYDEAIEYLHRAVVTAEKIDAFPNRNAPDEPLILHTAPLVRGVTETPPSGKRYAVDNLRHYLADSAFDPIRDRHDFPKPPYHTEA